MLILDHSNFFSSPTYSSDQNCLYYHDGTDLLIIEKGLDLTELSLFSTFVQVFSLFSIKIIIIFYLRLHYHQYLFLKDLVQIHKYLGLYYCSSNF